MNCIGNYNAQIATGIPNHIMMEVVDPGREKDIQNGMTILRMDLFI